MCGIVGIYYKNKALSSNLGSSLAAMLVEMSDRGPDSAGVAIYREPEQTKTLKVSVYSPHAEDWAALAKELGQALNAPC